MCVAAMICARLLPLIAAALWDVVEREMPDVLGPRNFRNELIKELFGDQNGH